MRKPRTRKPREPKQTPSLPAPVDVQPSPAPAQPESLASKVANLFGSPKQTATPVSQTVSIDSSASYGGGEPLSAEAETLLASVPDTIGGTSAPGEAQSDSLPDPQDPIAALMAQVAFEEQDVRDTLGEMFDWLAEKFESDHWKLSERQGRMLGKPAAMMLNSIWAKLQVYIPDILGRWCEDTPGATAFLLACGVVIVPKVTKQIAVSKARKRVLPMVREGTSHYVPPAPQPITAREAVAESKRESMIYDQGEV